MKKHQFEVEPYTLFSKSMIWQLNRDYYQQVGIAAWSNDIVPHHITSNSLVGKTYAELILGFLKDLAAKGQTQETVYILELGAGHGRLAFHILQHLRKITDWMDVELPPFCYILSDIVEENLLFFKNHPQLQTFFEQGILEVAHFDAIGSKTIHLQYSNKTIRSQDLKQPLLAIANYFFDSLPTDIFHVKSEKIAACAVELRSREDPATTETSKLINSLTFDFKEEILHKPFYEQAIANEILENYKTLLKDSYVFFPYAGLQCLDNLIDFSAQGLMVLSMDKGFHQLHNIDQQKKPDVITHGSLSIWVNYHALGAYCTQKGGQFMFPDYSTFHIQMGCLLFLKNSESFIHTNLAYQQHINDFGPDDYNSLKKIAYGNVAQLSVIEFLAFLRLCYYDSTFFIKILPYLKKAAHQVTFDQRKRIAQSMHQVWRYYFDIQEPFDMAYEIGGFFYDLGFYPEALLYFDHSAQVYGLKDDIYYNNILCYYQLRQDDLFTKTLKEAKAVFPDSLMFKKLEALDLGAV